MIKIELSNNPGYPTTNPEYLGFIKQWYKPAIPGIDCAHYWATASVNCDYRSTLEVRRYLCGLEPPNFPVPAIPTVCFILPDRVWIEDVDSWDLFHYP